MKRTVNYPMAMIIALVLLAAGWVIGHATGDNFYANIRLFDRVAADVASKYVEEVNIQELIFAGVKGMMETLDPHSQFFEKQQYDHLTIETKGEFEGLGIQIDIRDGWLTVVAPIEGTPAHRMGLRPGDKIIKIEGKTTKDITIEDAVHTLRGPKGTEVTITIEREGEEPADYTITRDVIKIKSVPYYGMVEDGIGYVRLSRFSQQATSELKTALEELKPKVTKGLILDLRSNPGGLLPQAVQISNLFLDKPKKIVYTQGRMKSQNQEFHADQPAVYADGPLIVLVNQGSASASEIVSGAVQDWDRGLLLGSPTFGKGSVQTVFPMANDVALKLTVAKWYIPSGRCIQKDWNPDKAEEDEGDQEEVQVEGSQEIFNTMGGRTVYGGGGITPDLIVESEKMNRLEMALERQSMFFNFAIHYTAEHQLERNFVVDDAMIDDFRTFLNEKEFTYKTEAELKLEELESIIAEKEYGGRITQTIEELRAQIQEEKAKEFQQSMDYIETGLRREIVGALWGREALYEMVTLAVDPQIARAVEILRTPKEYEKLLGL